jgi:hypothetical protein
VNGRWFAVGRSAADDAYTAGLESASAALVRDDAKLLVVFCSDSYDLEELLVGINERSGGVPLIGCSTAGEISATGAGDASVVVSALGGTGFSVATSVATDASNDLRGAGSAASECLGQVGGAQHRVLMLLTDGLAGDQQEIVRGAYAVAGAGVPLVGGCAGDGLKMQQTSQLYADRVLTDAVVGAALGSDAPMGIGVRHGWRKVGEPMLVTKSAGNRVFVLDGRPALDVYLERLEAPDAARNDPTAFTHFAMTHPLGLQRRSGEEVRFVAEADFADRSLGCIAEVPQGGLTWIMEGDRESVLHGTDAACEEAMTTLAGQTPIGVLAFDCIARRGVLGDAGIEAEVARIGEHVGGVPIAGFYTYGEIARTHGVGGFHNQTLVVLALS